MSGKVQEVTDATFDSEVVSAGLPVLVDFWSTGCAPCRAMAPIIDQLAAENEGRVKFVKVNIAENPNIAQRYRLQAAPTFMVFKGGEPVASVLGMVPKEALQRKLAQV